MFETAIYTDVLAEESLDGRRGFNFQSASPGFTAIAQQVAVQHMLHQAGAPGAEQATEDETATSFCYRPVGGQYFFSQWRDLGATASGRGGNQITEIAVTDTAEDFEPYTPAQVYSSLTWDVSKRASRSSDPWVPPLDIAADFETDQLLAWVLDDDGRRSFLPRLLTAFEEKITGRSPGPLILVGQELPHILRWLSTVSLLSNQQAVRSLSFRAFDASPLRGTTDVVGCRPEVAQGLEASHLLCDLDRLTGGSEQTSFAVDRTIALLGERSTYEALDIVSLARRWDPALGSTSAFWASELVNGTLPESALVGGESRIVTVVEGLARSGFTDDLETYLDEFGDALGRLPGHAGTDVVRLARGARLLAHGANQPLAALLLDASLSRVAESPQGISDWAGELLATDGSPWPVAELPATHWGEALGDLVDVAPAADLPSLFALAEHLPSDALRPGVWQDAEQRLVDSALSRPAELEATRALRVGARIRDSVRLEVVRPLDIALQDQPGLLDGHPAFEALRRGEWGPLIDASAGDEGTSASALWTWCRIASLVRMPAKQRRDALRHETALRALHWKAVLASTDPRNDQELWEAWLQRFGAGPEQGLYVHVMAEVERDLMGPPTRALKRWKRLVRVLEDTMDGSAARRAAELGDRIDSRLDDRVTFGSKVRSWAPGRRADGDSDGSGGPPGSSTGRHPDRRRR